MGLRLADLARVAGLGYGTVCRAVAGLPIGVDLAEKLAATMGVDFPGLIAGEDERRPECGYSPAALEAFVKGLRGRIEEAVAEAHADVARESARRCWFWPSLKVVRGMLTMKCRMEGKEVSLL